MGEGEAIGLVANWMEFKDEPSLGSKQPGGSQDEGGLRSLGGWKRPKEGYRSLPLGEKPSPQPG